MYGNEMMRAEFEKTQPMMLLVRSEDGRYANPVIEFAWGIWQTAWTACLTTRPARVPEHAQD
jgi:hypothetical protein